ncbi:hypothetical protein [Mycobacterium sp. DBP42]|uniref:hypothetical protein n=1 Tax=Mycobacteriaceae TaxID=1762 RepID=UPI00110D230D|nr:hypothetical protein [Mycobacterium sp. DBP42]TMS50663.1 hypothetical protein E0T84_22480 [Mycobacterium sp. DBP42]
MSPGLAEVLPAAGCREVDIDEPLPPPYREWDLTTRRSALSLWPEDLAPLFGINVARYRVQEPGEWSFSPELATELIARKAVEELIAMEAWVSGETDRLIAAAPAEGTVVLDAVLDQDLFTLDYPEAHTYRRRAAYPVTLQHVAVGRAAAELTRRDRDVEVFRGDRHFDLTAGRLAIGLGKKETAHLLGLNVKTFQTSERGTKPPSGATLDELQSIDDFITAAAGSLQISGEGSVSIIRILDDQAQFETAYPKACARRSGTPYPVRVLRVAAVRRAHALEQVGQSVRFATAAESTT